MSLQIFKAGIFDTIQDTGRWGHQYLGINPGGSMDHFSARLANALLGKELSDPVFELHFPASQIQFKKDTIICITGAHFAPEINEKEIPLHHPVVVKKGALLRFHKLQSGARAYLSLWNRLDLKPWMNSYSTHFRAKEGGYQGRALITGDKIAFSNGTDLSGILKYEDHVVLPWSTSDVVDARHELQFLMGSEWYQLTREAQEEFQSNWYQITNDADRMGYKLAGNRLQLKPSGELVSSAVCFGTVQLLPGGQLIVLMADHQTAGGYPRIAHIISAHLPLLAQKKPNDVLRFQLTDLQTAESKKIKQDNFLREIRSACAMKLENLLHVH
jgi:antagonist of KipI